MTKVRLEVALLESFFATFRQMLFPCATVMFVVPLRICLFPTQPLLPAAIASFPAL